MVGVPRFKHSYATRIVQPTTLSHQAANLTNLTPAVQPSTPSRQVPRTTLSTPIHASSSMPSAHGSETRLAAIITALNDIQLDDLSHYVVVRGEKPGVYASRFVSVLFFTIFLIFEISISARAALGTNQRNLCYFVASKEAADAKYVGKSMAGKVEYL